MFSSIANTQQVWDEQEDAGQLINTAQTAVGLGQLDWILGSFANPTDVDLYRFRIVDAENFSVHTFFTASINPGIDTQLFLFDESGRLVISNDDAGGGLFSQISGTDTSLTAGDHYLAINLFNNDPILTGGPNGRLENWNDNVSSPQSGNYHLNFEHIDYAPQSNSAYRQVLAEKGLGDTFDAPTINDTGDVAFFADSYNGQTGIYANYTGLGDVSGSGRYAVDTVALEGDKYFVSSAANFIGDSDDNAGFASFPTTLNFDDPDARDFAFTRHGTYFKGELDTDIDVVVQASQRFNGNDREFEYDFLIGNTTNADINDEYFEIVDFIGVAGPKIVAAHNATATAGIISGGVGPGQFLTGNGGGTNYDIDYEAFQAIRITDNGTGYWDYRYTTVGDPRNIVEFGETFSAIWDNLDGNGIIDEWTASDAGVVVLATGGAEGRGLYAGTSADTLLVNGSTTSVGLIQGLGRWFRLDNHGNAVLPASIDQNAVILWSPLFDNQSADKILVENGQLAPDGDGTINVSTFQNDGSKFHLNNEGQFLYEATLSGTPNNRGVFLTDGIETLQVARLNQALDPFTTLTDFELKSGDDIGGRQALNDWGQVAFKGLVDVSIPGVVSDSGEAIYVYTPELSFRGTAGDGQWDSKTNWTLSIDPAPVHHVTVQAGAVVDGPGADTAIEALTVAGELALAAFPVLSISDSLVLEDEALLSLDLLGGGDHEPTLDVGGDVWLDGTLALSAELTPFVGQRFDVLTYGGVLLGDFDAVTGGFTLDTSVDGTITAVFGGAATLEGDYNGDGFVSQPDLDLVLLNWGDGVLPGGFDADAIPGGGPFDSLVSQNELDGVLLNWGDGNPPNANAIPEPGVAGVLGLAVVPWVFARRRSGAVGHGTLCVAR